MLECLCAAEPGPEPRIGVQELRHVLRAPGGDDRRRRSVVLHTAKQGFDCFAPDARGWRAIARASLLESPPAQVHAVLAAELGRGRTAAADGVLTGTERIGTGIEQAAHWTAAGLDEAIECQSA